MTYFKQTFDINDLAEISGIKKHTIRIWEKRYSILNPERTIKNFRIYNIDDLQKILNIVFLNKSGYSISRLAKLSDVELGKMVLNVTGSNSSKMEALINFKIAVINFDQPLFDKTYLQLTNNLTFRQIFKKLFISLIEEIKILRQKKILKPIHYHFLVNLLREKLILNTPLQENEGSFSHKELYVLFLPETEIDELMLLFVNYELTIRKRRTFLLPHGISLEYLQYLTNIHKDPVLVGFITAPPKEILNFINAFEKEICKESYKELVLLGETLPSLSPWEHESQIKIFPSISEFVSTLSLVDSY